MFCIAECIEIKYCFFPFTDGNSNTWSVRLGQLLLSAKKKDIASFYETLKVVQAEQIVPLSAASFERGSYQRGYEYIIRCVLLSVCKFSMLKV